MKEGQKLLQYQHRSVLLISLPFPNQTCFLLQEEGSLSSRAMAETKSSYYIMLG
jgi:hypothetical protein